MSDKFEVKEILFAIRDEAENTLSRLKEIAKDYGMVRVADLYDLIGYLSAYTDSLYVWMPSLINNAKILRVRDGWTIDLPAPSLYESSYDPQKQSKAKVTYRNYYTPVSKPKTSPKTLTIAIDYAGVEDEFDNVLEKALQYAQTITDREVKIDIC